MNSTPSLESQQARLPRQVVRAAERAAQLQQETTRSTAANEPLATASEASAAPPAAPHVAAAPPPAADPRQTDWQYWKKRYEVTQGFLDDLRTKRQEESRSAQDRIRDLTRKVQELESQKPQGDVELSSMFTPEEIERIGRAEAQALANAATRQAQNIARAEIDKQLQPLRDQQEQDRQTEQQKKATRFYDEIAQEVPNWREINDSDGWKLFLGEEDDGVVRQDIIDLAVEKARAKPIVKLLKQYEATLNPADVAAQPPVLPQGGALQGSGGSNPPPPSQRFPTPAEVKKFFTDCALGRYRGRDTERGAFEARINAARAAGYLR
jgi:hypothetical protein